jgi:hypothetical protein
MTAVTLLSSLADGQRVGALMRGAAEDDVRAAGSCGGGWHVPPSIGRISVRGVTNRQYQSNEASFDLGTFWTPQSHEFRHGMTTSQLRTCRAAGRLLL